MAKRKLTSKFVEKALKKPGRYRDSEVRGLLLCVTSVTNASWALRYQLRGAEHMLGLGSAREFSIKAARERALTARRLIADKIDPLAEKRAANAAAKLADAKAMSFGDAAQQYFDQNSATWTSNKHRAQFLSSIKQYVLPIIGGLPVSAIDTALMLLVLEQRVEADESFGLPGGRFWDARSETARRVRNRIEQILGWATVRGLRQGDNPARWRNHLANVLPAARGRAAAVTHHAALPYAEVGAFMTELRQREGTPARALEFLVLTCARTGEVRGATWDEIDLNEKTWTIPAARMKGGKEHRVPLSPRAVALLQSAYTQKNNEHIFIGADGTGISKGAMAAVVTRLERDGVTIHGFRSSFRDWAAERSSFAPHIIELCLAHSVGSAVEQAYRRGDLMDKRRQVMDSWASYCASPAVEGGATVVPLRSAAP